MVRGGEEVGTLRGRGRKEFFFFFFLKELVGFCPPSEIPPQLLY